MLTFGAPLFLAGLAGLLAPLLIHLINKERATPLRFPSIRYINRSALPQRGRRSPRDWFLLLLRMLFYAAVVIALAQPKWVETDLNGVVASEDSTTPILFVVDSSASMSARGAWESAESIIDETLDSVSQSTPVGWVFFAQGNLATQSPAPGQMPDLDKLAPTIHESNPAMALREAMTLLPEGEPAELVVISDFQSSDWSRTDWPTVPNNVTLNFQPIHKDTPDNIGIVAADVFPAPGGNLRVIARVKNFSDEALQATLRMGSAFEDALTLQPGELLPVSFVVPRDNPGAVELSLETGDDYSADDTYRLWLDAPPPLLVGAILPAAEEPDKLAEADFIARALQTDAETGHRAFRLAPLGPDMKLQEGVTPDIIYVAGAAGYLDSQQLAALKAYVEGGGVLFITPSQAGSRQQSRLRESGLTDNAYIAQPGRHGDRSEMYHIGSLNEQSFLGELFDEQTSQDLYLASIYEYLKLRPGQDATILMATEEGDPLMLEERLGKGMVITSALGLDTSWSDLPLRNSYLPLLREALAESVGGKESVTRLELGQIEGYSEPTAFIDAQGNPVEVNVSRDESDFTPISLASLRASLVPVEQARPVSSAALEEGSGLSLWPYFAIAALALFIMESTLAGMSPAVRKVQHA